MNMLTKFFVATTMSALFADAVADAPAHSDEEIKAQFVFAGMCRHAEDIESNYDYAFRMADNDTNRYARVLSELAQENAKQTRRVIHMLGLYKTNQSLPFLYSYATNATYGSYALKSIFAIEGVTSNSVAAVHNYLFSTNWFPFSEIGRRSDACTDLLKKVFGDLSFVEYRPVALGMATNFLQNVELMPNVLDGTLCNLQDGFRFSKRRISALRAAKQRVTIELEDATTNNYEVGRRIYCYTFQTNYLQNAINELVAYPEANLPD
jgi:hypothetical protein